MKLEPDEIIKHKAFMAGASYMLSKLAELEVFDPKIASNLRSLMTPGIKHYADQYAITPDTSPVLGVRGP